MKLVCPKRIAIGIMVIASMTMAVSALAAPSISDILKKVDAMDDLGSDLTAKFQLTQQSAGEGARVTEGIYYQRDSDKSFLIIMTSPEAEKGNGYLKQGDNFWLYRRNTRTFQHINRDENISGTDVSTEDMENRKLVDMYKPSVDKSGKEKISETRLGEIPVYQFEVAAKVENISYPKRVYWVRKDNLLPLKTQAYSKNGVLMETEYFLKYTEIDGRYFMLKSMYVDEFEKGNKTLLDVTSISLKKLSPDIFTKAYLENLSK